MQTPTQTERQALTAAISAANSAADADPITLQAPPARRLYWFGRGNHCGTMTVSASYFDRAHGERPGAQWWGVEKLRDQLGRVWARDYRAVVDDFGNLVEVQP